MRLTLRTLMAYLDDVLSPADTKAIGQKIQESPMAQLLVSRIREVMRRRRLKAPDVAGAEIGIDPNIVAQYLDNTLPADQYADVERILLSSDELLAETAACHQILTLVLGDSSEVSVESRERLYALGPVPASSQLTVSSDTTFGSKSRTPESIPIFASAEPAATATAHRGDANENQVTTVPDYLKPAPWPNRVVPSAAVLLLVVFCAALLAPGFLTGVRQANKEIQRQVNRERTPSIVKPVDEENQVAADESLPPSPDAGKLKTTEPVASEVASTPPPSNDVDASANEVDPVTTPLENQTKPPLDSVATASEPVSPTETSPPPEPNEPANDAVVTPPKPKAIPQEILAELGVKYTSSEGVIVQLNDQKNQWFVAAHQTEFLPESLIANLEPFEGNLELEKAGVKATLIGESVIKLLPPSETALQGMAIIGRGRFLFQTSRSEEGAKGQTGIAIGEDLWKLELMTPDTICGLEVTSREPSQFMKLNDYHWYQATLFVLSGNAKWTNQAGNSVTLNAYTALNVIPERAATIRTEPISFASSPDWTDASKRRSQPLKRFKPLFEKTFLPDEPVEQTMITVVQGSRNAKIAELAARCLSAIDDCAGLVETLAGCPHEEARFAARDGLRKWLPMDPNFGPRLKTELAKYYPPNEADAVYRMLWGFTQEDVKGNKVNSRQIVEWLRSPKLEIRELADYWVERLKGKNDFKPSGSEKLRESYVKRLEDQIDHDNGLIKSQ